MTNSREKLFGAKQAIISVSGDTAFVESNSSGDSKSDIPKPANCYKNANDIWIAINTE